jgi:hypothetical protein
MRNSIPFGIALMALTVSPAHSDDQRQEQTQTTEPKLVCRSVHEIGSRLKVRKVCMTAEQWADQRRQDRMLIERSQTNACTPGANC